MMAGLPYSTYLTSRVAGGYEDSKRPNQPQCFHGLLLYEGVSTIRPNYVRTPCRKAKSASRSQVGTKRSVTGQARRHSL